MLVSSHMTSHFFEDVPSSRPTGSRKESADNVMSCCAFLTWRILQIPLQVSYLMGAQRKLETLSAPKQRSLRFFRLIEPAAGMNPAETDELMENVLKIRDDFKIAVLLTEHDM